MRLKHRLKKLSAGQKRLKTENFAKNGMHRPIAYVYVEILVIPFDDEKVIGVWVSFGRSGLEACMPAKGNYPRYSSTGAHGIHGLLKGSISSDTPLYRLDPEVLLSDSLLILKREFDSFGTFSSERTQYWLLSENNKKSLEPFGKIYITKTNNNIARGEAMVSRLRYILRWIKRKVLHLSDWNIKSATWCSTLESGWALENKVLNRSKLWMS